MEGQPEKSMVTLHQTVHTLFSSRAQERPDDFLKLCLRVLQLPSVILGNTLPTQKRASDGMVSLPAKLRKAESLAFQDRLHDATKVLFSNGITPPSEAVFARLQALHPSLKAEIPEIKTHEEQFSISPEQTPGALYRNCGDLEITRSLRMVDSPTSPDQSRQV